MAEAGEAPVPPTAASSFATAVAAALGGVVVGKTNRKEGQPLLDTADERGPGCGGGGGGGGGGATASDHHDAAAAAAAAEDSTTTTSATLTSSSSVGFVGGRARSVGVATLVMASVLALAAVTVPWGGGAVGDVGGGNGPFATLGAAGHKLGKGVRHGGGRRAGSATTAPKAPGTLASFNPFTESRGLKLTPRQLPPLTPAGLAKSQKATMMLDQVGAQWLMSSAAAAEEDTRKKNRKNKRDRERDDEEDEDEVEEEEETRGGRRGGDDYDASPKSSRRGRGSKKSAARKQQQGRGGGGGGGGGGKSKRDIAMPRLGAAEVDDYDDDRRLSSSRGGGAGGRKGNKRGGGSMERRSRDRDMQEPMLGEGEPANLQEWSDAWNDAEAQPGTSGGGGGGMGGRSEGREGAGLSSSSSEDAFRWQDDGDYGGGGGGGERSSFVARGRSDVRRGGGGDAASAAASRAARSRVRQQVTQQSNGRNRGGGGGMGWVDDYAASASSSAGNGADAYLGAGSRGDDYAVEVQPPRQQQRRQREQEEDADRTGGDGNGNGRGSAKGMSRSDASKLGKSPRPCILKRTATSKQAQAVLDYACNPVHGMSCAPISKGGKAYYPNTKHDHAAWAIHQFFRRRSQEPDAFPQQDCHFVGVASLNVPGNFYLTAGGALTRANHHTDVITRKVQVPPEGFYFKTQEDIVGELSGQADAFDPLHATSAPSTSFKFWMGAARGSSGCMVEATVIYDFDGDNRPDRTETFELQGVPEEPDLIPVETKVLGHSLKARGDKFWSAVTNAKVQLFVKSPNCPGEVNVWESAAMYPSFLTVPYRAPLGN